MSNDTQKADQIAFHFYTKLFYTVNHARATEESNLTSRVDKWFNLETPDSDLFTKEAREPYRSISLAPAPGPPPLEIQVLLSVPELTNNQVLVYMSPDSSRVRIEPTPKFILLETWTLAMRNGPASNQHGDASADASLLPIIYKHGIVLFRSVFSLLRVLPAWKFYKRLKRKTGGVNRNGHLGITLRVRSSGDSETDGSILGFGAKPSPTHRSPLSTSTHTFPTVAHLLGSFTLSTTYLTSPDFQLDELESLLSSRFISLDLEGFIPTLDKNRQRDSMSGSSSLPNSSGIRSVLSRSPPKPIAWATSTGGGGATNTDSLTVADRFILPSRVPSIGASTLGTTASTGTSALIPPPRPFPTMNPSNPSINSGPFSNLSSVAAQPIPASGLAVNRLRKESLNSSSSSSVSTRDPPPSGPNQGTSSLSSSPVSGPLPIRRPNINPVHPFKSNTLSSASGSSPSLSIRQGAGAIVGGGSPGMPSSLSGTGVVPPSHSHSRQTSSASPIGNPARLPPSPITGFSAHPSPPPGTTVFSPSSLGDRRPGTSGSGASSDRDRRISMQSLGMGSTGGDSDDGRFPMGMAMPPRKRYSSSFGHRYVGSIGSGTGIVIGSASGTAGSNEGRTGMVGDTSMPGSGNVSGRATPASLGGGGQEGKKEGVASFLGTATDDDDISIFVQDIDSRKPLSGRVKEREKREELEERERLWQYTHRGQVHEHERDVAESTVKGKERERAPRYNISAQDRRPLDEVFADDAAYTTSPQDANPDYLHPLSNLDMTPSADAAERAAQFSTSPTRSPMLTSQNEVEERLKKMNETFLKSLEGFSGGSTRRKARRKDNDKDASISTSSAVPVDGEREKGREGSSSSSSSSGNYPSRASRGLGLGFPSSRASGAERDLYSPYPYNTPGLGLGLGRGRYASTSSSTLANSEAGASQGSEEVIGRMDLYDERRRSGYQG